MTRIIARFMKDEDGSMLHFSLVVFVGFLAAAGMGADFMRYELYRADLQNSLDRGVLAATAFSQTEDPVDVITEFVQESEKWNGNGLVPQVNATRFPNDDTWFTGPVNERTIRANASVTVNTHFLQFFGMNELTVNASSNSSQTRNPVEVVMVLDISASMAAIDSSTRESRISGLRTAAKDFIDKVLTPETVDLTSVTLVPFGGSVNPGDFSDFMTNIDGGTLPSWATDPDLTNGTRDNYPLCPQFSILDFSPTDIDNIDLDARYDATRLFKRYNSWDNERRWGWCPENNAGIVLHSNDADTLKARIDSMQLYDGTGIDLGLKWGLYAMSPNSRSVVNSLVGTDPGDIHENFRNWPNNFNDEAVEKYVVFLTDGGITDQMDLRDELWDNTLADLSDPERLADDLDIFTNDADREKIINHIGKFIDDDDLLADYWSLPNSDYFSTLTPSNARDRLNVIQGNSTNSVGWRTNNNLKNSQISNATETLWSANQATIHVENICNFFKNEKTDGTDYVRVFTIGFNINNLNLDTYAVPPNASSVSNNHDRIAFVLDHCATSESDEFTADSTTLSTAFDEIAAQINSLRLTN